MLKKPILACAAMLVWLASASATMGDSTNQPTVTPRRIITLSPHATELVFAAGGGSRIAATVQASDFPAAARALPRIGDGLVPEPERLLRWRPDLIIGWQVSQFANLASLNIPTFLSAPVVLSDIPDTIEKLGTLLGTSEIAQPRAASLRQSLARLKQPAPPQPRVRVFLQVGEPPEFSLNRAHLLSQIIEACGGVNVFADATAIAPQISAEGVLAQRPDLILLGRVGASAQPSPDKDTQKYWLRLNLPAAQANQVFVMDSDVLYRPGPRLIEAAEAICSMIQQARK